MTNKLFKYVGISETNGQAKVRFTDDMYRRVKLFNKGGASRCEFIELETPMTKVDALKVLAKHPDFSSPADQATIEECLHDREKTVKVKVPKDKVKKAISKSKTKDAITTVTDVISNIQKRNKKNTAIPESNVAPA